MLFVSSKNASAKKHAIFFLTALLVVLTVGNQAHAFELDTTQQYNGTCLVIKDEIITDKEPCNVVQQTNVGATEVRTFYTWPSGSRTVEVKLDNRISLNGNPATLIQKTPNGRCLRSKPSGKVFCFAPKVPVEASSADNWCVNRHRVLQKMAKRVRVDSDVGRAMEIGQTFSVKWNIGKSLFPDDEEVFLVIKYANNLTMNGRFEPQHALGTTPKNINVRLIQLNNLDAHEAKKSTLQGFKEFHENRSKHFRTGGEFVGQAVGNGQTFFSYEIVSSKKNARKCAEQRLTKVKRIDFLIKPPTKYSATRPCHIHKRENKNGAPQINVDVQLPKVIKAGEPLRVHWALLDNIAKSCRNPLYLVFSMPREVRFNGHGRILALTNGADGPYGLKYKKDQVRVFVPLQLDPKLRRGYFDVKVYRSGGFKLNWALIELPPAVKHPFLKGDIRGEHPVIAYGSKGRVTFHVEPGNPYIVAQDRFSLDSPKQTVLSNSGEFELQIFDGFYRVLDSSTGALIIERDGTNPTLSPSSRFLHAEIKSGFQMEVVDLVANRLAGVLEDNGSTILSAKVHTVSWGMGDSFFVTAKGTSGGWLSATLIDDGVQDLNIPSPGNYKTSLEEVAMNIDIENLAISKFIADAKKSDREVEHQHLLAVLNDEHEAFAPLDGKIIGKYFLRPVFSSDLKTKEIPWSIGSNMSVSYDDSLNLGKAALKNGYEYIREEKIREQMLRDATRRFEFLSSIYVEHEKLRGARISQRKSRRSLNEPLRGIEVGRGLNRLINSPTQRIEARVRQRWIQLLGGNFEHTSNTYQIDMDLVNFSRNSGKIELPRSLIEQLSKQLIEGGDGDTWQNYFSDLLSSNSEQISLKSSAQFCEYDVIAPAQLIMAKVWKRGGTLTWLLQSQCFTGNGIPTEFGELAVMETRSDGVSHIRKISVGSIAGNQNDEDNLSVDLVVPAQAWLAQNGYLLISVSNRNILVYDLNQPIKEKTSLSPRSPVSQNEIFKQVVYIENAPNGDLVQELSLSTDGQRLFQFNQNGSIYVYNTTTSKKILNGAFLDDELLVFSDDGTYASTPEGDHYAFMKFPGVSGHHSFRQFKKLLNRPQVIRSILSGKTVVKEELSLAAPPTVDFTLDQSKANLLAVRASAASGLARMDVYVDGQRLIQKEISGSEQRIEQKLKLPAEAQWLTVVAVDKRGFESIPKSTSLPPSINKPEGRLFAVSVGTDKYKDPSIPNLGLAKADAETFSAMVQSMGNARYRSVQSIKLLDVAGLADDLKEKLRIITNKASSSDTIMLHVAGHGMVDQKGEFYLLGSETIQSNLIETSVHWSDIASILSSARARVFVFLDACHSGAADGLASNDEAVAAFLNRNSSITVIAASKGRQESEEHASLAGGVFTTSLAQIVGFEHTKSDLNGNGVIELSELYAALKQKVVTQTSGRQTPWIARNQMVGEIPVF